MRALPILLTLAALLPAVPAVASEPALVVQLASGRQFTGVIDSSSNREQLVLRTEGAGLIIRRPIRWERIVAATRGGAPLEMEALREEVREQPSGDGSQRSEGGMQRDGQPREIRLGPTEHVEELPAVEPAAVIQPRRVRSVTFDARVANWDGGVEADGVVLDLAPLDWGGYVAPVSGTLIVELFAPQRRAFQHAPLAGGDTLELVERWHRAVHAAEFGPEGVRLRLPFGAVHPELDWHWTAWHYGLVHVRLIAPGHGTFDHSIDGIRIRPWAPNRDQLELNTGRRFLPTEALGRSD